MKLTLKILAMSILLVFTHHQVHAQSLTDDSTLYRQVLDSLIYIAVKAKQLRPIVFISKSKQLRANKSIVDGNIGLTVRQYAEDSINYIRRDENVKVQSNRELRNALLQIQQLKRKQTPFSITGSGAQIRYKRNGWSVFKSYDRIKRYRKSHPEFFCVADMTEPIYTGNYAIIVVDRQFNPLGGGGYMHIFNRVKANWQTYAIVTLWNY